MPVEFIQKKSGAFNARSMHLAEIPLKDHTRGDMRGVCLVYTFKKDIKFVLLPLLAQQPKAI